MLKRNKREQGSLNVAIFAVIFLVAVGGIGFIFWKNFINKDTAGQIDQQVAKDSTSTLPIKKSEVVVLQDSDMDKYVNYEQGFEFLFPKNIYASIQCTTSNTVHDYYNNIVPSQAYQTAINGSAPMTVLEGDGRFIITTKNMVVTSSTIHTGGRSFPQKCDVEQSTISLVDFKNTLDGDKYVPNQYVREFDVVSAKNQADITNFIRKQINDSGASIYKMGPVSNDRQEVTFAFGPSRHVGGFAYKLWFYPTRQRLVYIDLGQGSVFTNSDPVKSSTTEVFYDFKVADSFKFTAN